MSNLFNTGSRVNHNWIYMRWLVNKDHYIIIGAIDRDYFTVSLSDQLHWIIIQYMEHYHIIGAIDREYFIVSLSDQLSYIRWNILEYVISRLSHCYISMSVHYHIILLHYYINQQGIILWISHWLGRTEVITSIVQDYGRERVFNITNIIILY